LVVGCWLLVVGYWLLVVGYWAGKPRPYTPIADCLQQSCLRPTA